MKTYYSAEDVLLDKIESFTCWKDSSYKDQIENSLRHLAELFQSSIPLRPLRYDIIEEYNDCIIVRLSNKGKIKVNER